MPHVNIKFFATDLSEQQKQTLNNGINRAIESALGCEEKFVSIALEPIESTVWQDRVYQPEIQGRNHLLCQQPGY